MMKLLTVGEMLSMDVLRLKTSVVPQAAPVLRPTSTNTASAGRRKRLVKMTGRSCLPLGWMCTWLPRGSWKSRASRPATMAWYVSGLLLGFVSRT